MSVNEKMTAIADSIREKTGSTGKLSLDQMVTSIGEVYEVGKEVGETEGIERLCNAITWNYNRKDYQYAFYWTDYSWLTFPQTVYPTSSIYRIFSSYQGTELPKNISFEKVTYSGTHQFQTCTYLTHVPDLNWAAQSAYTATFQNCSRLVTIDVLRVKESTTFDSTFYNCRALVDITFEGSIGQNITFEFSVVLSKASIKGIIEHLSDSASGKTLTLTTEAVTAAFGSTTATEWTNLVATKSNWTITLIQGVSA